MSYPKPNVVQVQIPASNFGVGRRSAISQISEHHVVGDSQHVINKAKTQQFSTTYTIAMDGTIYQLVDESNTPYCDNDYRSNGRSITIEHAGGHANFPYTEAMYQSSIKLHAYLFSKYGILNCVRHREIPEVKADPAKATACPGQLDVERIVSQAKKLLSGNGVEEMTDENYVRAFFIDLFDVTATPEQVATYINRPYKEVYNELRNAPPYRARRDYIKQVIIDNNARAEAITVLRKQADELAQRPTKETFDQLHGELVRCDENMKTTAAQNHALEEEKKLSQQTGNSILRFIADWWNSRKK